MFLPWKRWCLTPSIRLFYITFTFRMNLSVMGLSTLKGWGKPLNSHSFISFINISDSSFWKCVCVYIIWNLQTIKCWRDNFFFHSKFSYIYWISFILKLRTKLIHGWMQKIITIITILLMIFIIIIIIIINPADWKRKKIV